MTWLSRELITSPYYIGLCTDEKAFNADLKNMRIPKKERPEFLINEYSNATVHFFENTDGKNCAIVCIHKKQPKKITRAQIDCLLVHEAVHIWQRVKENIGERFPSLEFEAYSIQSIAQSLIEEYHRKVPK